MFASHEIRQCASVVLFNAIVDRQFICCGYFVRAEDADMLFDLWDDIRKHLEMVCYPFANSKFCRFKTGCVSAVTSNKPTRRYFYEYFDSWLKNWKRSCCVDIPCLSQQPKLLRLQPPLTAPLQQYSAAPLIFRRRRLISKQTLNAVFRFCAEIFKQRNCSLSYFRWHAFRSKFIYACVWRLWRHTVLFFWCVFQMSADKLIGCLNCV